MLSVSVCVFVSFLCLFSCVFVFFLNVLFGSFVLFSIAFVLCFLFCLSVFYLNVFISLRVIRFSFGQLIAYSTVLGFGFWA